MHEKISPTEVRLTGRLLCKNARELDIVTRHLPAHIELTRAEPGCISFEVAPTDDPLVWSVAERFATPAAFAAHQKRASASEWGSATTGIERDYVVTGLPEYVIRAPRPDEAKTLAELHNRTWREAYSGTFPPEAWNDDALAQRVAMWTFFCQTPRLTDRIAVAERDGELIGFAGSGATDDDPPVRPRTLFFIYLLEEEHGSGAAQALLDEVLGQDPAALWVLEDNPRARAFYERNGFAPDGARDTTDYGPDEIRMVR